MLERFINRTADQLIGRAPIGWELVVYAIVSCVFIVLLFTLIGLI